MQFEWIKFYSEFATKLLKYKNDREELIKKIIKVYQKIGIKLPKLESGNNIVDIDPFTIYGLFNKQITNANRVTIISGLAEEFEIEEKVPENYDGIPVLNNLKATFYGFIDDRNKDDINNLWEVFAAAIKLSEKDTEENRMEFSKWYDLVHDQRGIRWNITMGLYWIRPYTFINLDSRNRWFMLDVKNMPADFVEIAKTKITKLPYAKEYLSINDMCKSCLEIGKYEYKSYPEFSYYAWLASEQANQDISLNRERKKSKAAFLRWFKPLIIALRDLGGSASPTDVRMKIIKNEKLTQDEVNATRGKNNVNKFENEVAFARNYLASAGYIDRSVYGIWALTEAGRVVEMSDELASDIFYKIVTENKNKRANKGAAIADDFDTIHYWIYSPGENSCKWDEFYSLGIMAIGWGEIGDLTVFENKDEIKSKMKETYDSNLSYKNAAHVSWQFANEMKIGDIVFVKRGRNQIIGRGVVASNYEYDSERTDEYNNIRKINWTHNGEWEHPGKAVMKTLTDISLYTDDVEKLNAIFEDEYEEDIEEISKNYPVYNEDDFLEQVFMSEEEYKRIVSVLKKKKNIILQGAPGVGKTFIAKRLAYSIMGMKDIDRVMMVQFHQSYSYEDFIMGFRPSNNGFELKKGVFYSFCKKAEVDSDNEYFFIIDEINRGNLSKIFGELFMLIENDKRGVALQLLYSDEKFSIPANVHIIGMMNTADRSLAMLDYALRRRFAFIDIKPGFETNGFRDYRELLDNHKFDSLINCIESLNEVISKDESLGEGFCIGHSYFCNLNADNIDDQALYEIVEFEIVPLIQEYWFDEPTKVKDWSEKLRSTIK